MPIVWPQRRDNAPLEIHALSASHWVQNTVVRYKAAANNKHRTHTRTHNTRTHNWHSTTQTTLAPVKLTCGIQIPAVSHCTDNKTECAQQRNPQARILTTPCARKTLGDAPFEMCVCVCVFCVRERRHKLKCEMQNANCSLRFCFTERNNGGLYYTQNTRCRVILL